MWRWRWRDRPANPVGMLTEAAPAKLNLALHVRRRRADGQHELETLFAFTGFGDALAAEPAAGLSLAVGGPFAGPAGEGANNLVLRAARALAAAAGVDAGAALTLTKRIPVAAGFGGGSADAAAALRLLNRLWKLNWDAARLEALAATLGADVPACVTSCPSFGGGRGERLAPYDPGLAGTPLLLVNPRVAVATRDVFAGWDGVDRGPLDAGDWRAGRNDLEPPARAIAPAIGAVLAELAATGPALARMSGSGASCFALYADSDQRDAAIAALAAVRPGWWLMATAIRACQSLV